MNRYNHRQIVLGSEVLKPLRFSGVYVSGDPIAFATSVAALFDLTVQDENARTILQPTSATPLNQG
jgi:ferric-dicitrate binding protein FerR (iron transport regulator)